MSVRGFRSVNPDPPAMTVSNPAALHTSKVHTSSAKLNVLYYRDQDISYRP